MEKNGSPVERSVFIVTETKEYGRYVLFSKKYMRSFAVGINWLDSDRLKKPDVGDSFELPDSMLYEDVGKPIFSNRTLSFGLPRDGVALPEDFNVEEDLAFFTYGQTKERMKLQRFYG